MKVIVAGIVWSWIFFLPVEAAERTMMDQTGRTVRFLENPQRVIALAPSLAEIVFALGEGHRLVGVTQFSNFPPEVENLPQVGSYVRLDFEKIVSLRPDLCISIRDGNPPDTVQRFDALKIPVYVVDPHNLEGVVQTVLNIGDILNASHAAKTLASDMTTRIERVRSLAAKAPYRPGVFFQIGVSPIVSAGTGTFIHELIETAGGVNLAKGHNNYPRYSREEVILLWPEIIVITSMERNRMFEAVKADWAQWRQIPAVQNQRIFLIDSDTVDRPGPRLVQGLERLFSLFHPELAKGMF